MCEEHNSWVSLKQPNCFMFNPFKLLGYLIICVGTTGMSSACDTYSGVYAKKLRNY